MTGTMNLEATTNLVDNEQPRQVIESLTGESTDQLSQVDGTPSQHIGHNVSLCSCDSCIDSYLRTDYKPQLESLPPNLQRVPHYGDSSGNYFHTESESNNYQSSYPRGYPSYPTLNHYSGDYGYTDHSGYNPTFCNASSHYSTAPNYHYQNEQAPFRVDECFRTTPSTSQREFRSIAGLPLIPDSSTPPSEDMTAGSPDTDKTDPLSPQLTIVTATPPTSPFWNLDQTTNGTCTIPEMLPERTSKGVRLPPMLPPMANMQHPMAWNSPQMRGRPSMPPSFSQSNHPGVGQYSECPLPPSMLDLDYYSAYESSHYTDQQRDFGREVCGVCSAPASGRHYNGVTCEGCKGFFRRIVINGTQYECKNRRTGHCMINQENRRKCCKACRYQRCISIGMVPNMCLTKHKQRPAGDEVQPKPEASELESPRAAKKIKSESLDDGALGCTAVTSTPKLSFKVPKPTSD
ncbi:Vitamin D3 receptor A [Halotydeus destructor]|nr:Vitamin D3 receptor A [Halotydeus destructor]